VDADSENSTDHGVSRPSELLQAGGDQEEIDASGTTPLDAFTGSQ
jgi:hypothetical protein